MTRIWLALALALASAPGVAAADPQASDAQQQADKLFAEGRALITSNKPAEACEKFEAAIKLDPTAAGTMLNLGVCYEQLNKPKSALAWFRKTQARASETNLPDYEAAAKEHTRTLAVVVPTVTIEFTTPAPAGAKVRIDGEEIPSTDFERVEVDPGHHVLDVRARDKAPFHQDFDLDLKGTKIVSIALVEGTSVVVLDPGRPRRKLAYEIGAGGGVLWLATLGYGLYERHVNQGDDIDKANRAIHNLKVYGTTMFSVGAAAIGVAAFLYLTAPDKERLDQTVVAPAIGPDQLGFALSGAF